MKWEILKGSEKYFEGAPEWACYLACAVGEPHSDAWVSDADDKYQYTVGDCGEFKGEFINYEWPKGSKVIAERRPITEPDVNQQVTTEWNGEGLPPVGAKVMSTSGAAIIDFVGKDVIVYTNSDGQWSVRCDGVNGRLSPLQPEDVARDNAAEAMRDSVLSSDESLTCHQAIYCAIAAGKIPGVKLE